MMTKAFTREQLDTYFASFVGMEGGNPSAAVWFCDYSPTRSSPSLVAPLMPQLECPAWDSPFRARHAKEILRWQTHQRIAHIMSAAREMVLFGREDSGDWKRYLTEHLYRPLGREFMLSLFPLPIRTGDGQSWRRRYGMQPELASRRAYMTFCREGGVFVSSRRYVSVSGLRWWYVWASVMRTIMCMPSVCAGSHTKSTP